MTLSHDGFLKELWTIWARDAARAVLVARWFWQNLPEELVQQAAAVQQQAQAFQSSSQINQQVNLQLGALGISPAPSFGASFGPAMDPDYAMFTMIMGLIRQHCGEPGAAQPVPPQVLQLALAETVLRGQMDPVDAAIALASPVQRQQIAAAAQMMRMVGMDRMLRLQAVLQFAMILPRERIPVLLPEVRAKQTASAG